MKKKLIAWMLLAALAAGGIPAAAAGADPAAPTAAQPQAAGRFSLPAFDVSV